MLGLREIGPEVRKVKLEWMWDVAESEEIKYSVNGQTIIIATKPPKKIKLNPKSTQSERK